VSLAAALALLISAAGVGVALATLNRAYHEYAQQGQQRRAELFFSLRARLKDDDLAWVAELVDLATAGDPADIAEAEQELSEVALRYKRDYVGIFEEVCIFMEEGQIEPELANYMFGYYALLCEECLAFWNNINYDGPYWSVFHRFCSAMRTLRDAMEGSNPVTNLSAKKVQVVDSGGSKRLAGVMVTVRIPTQLRAAAGGLFEVEVDASTVGEALEALFDAHGDLRHRIAPDGQLRRFVNVYVSGEDIRFQQGLDTEIIEGDEVTILPAVAGG
jgi:molybdopterin synthase sulfur carrier subunit